MCSRGRACRCRYRCRCACGYLSGDIYNILIIIGVLVWMCVVLLSMMTTTAMMVVTDNEDDGNDYDDVDGVPRSDFENSPSVPGVQS